MFLRLLTGKLEVGPGGACRCHGGGSSRSGSPKNSCSLRRRAELCTCNPLGTPAASRTRWLARLQKWFSRELAHLVNEKEKHLQTAQPHCSLSAFPCGLWDFQDCFMMMSPQNSKNGSQIFCRLFFFSFEKEKKWNSRPDGLK